MRELIVAFLAKNITLPAFQEKLKTIENINEVLANFKHEGFVYKNYTTLEFAVKSKNIVLLNALIKADADIDCGIYKPILIAAENLADRDNSKNDMYFSILKLLLSNPDKVNINICDKDNATVLFHAVVKGQFEVVEYLLTQPKININMLSCRDVPPIFAAVDCGHDDIVKKLCQSGADLTPKMSYDIQNNKKIPIMVDLFTLAIDKKQTPIILTLLKYTKPSNDCWEDIYHTKNTAILKLFLDNGVDPNTTITINNIKDKAGKATLLQAACTSSFSDFVNMLLSYGADPNILYPEGQTLLCLLASMNKTDNMRLLLQSKKIKDINQADKDNSGNTPLHTAACHGRYEAVKLLLEYSAKSDIPNAHGEYPLNYIILKKHLKFIPLFKNDLNDYFFYSKLYSRKDGIRSIHHAIYHNEAELLTRICQNTANPNYQKGDCLSPLIFAIFRQEKKILNILLNFGANPNGCPEDITRPIEVTIRFNDAEAAEVLIKHPNFIQEARFLCCAIERDCPDIVKVFLNNGFDSLAKVKLITPFFSAVYFNREEIIELIVDSLKKNNRIMDLKNHIMSLLNQLEAFIEDSDLTGQIYDKLKNILSSISSFSPTKKTETNKIEPKKTEITLENQTHTFFTEQFTSVSVSSHSYLSRELGWTSEQIKQSKEELKQKRIKRKEIVMIQKNNVITEQNFTWFEGMLNSSMLQGIEGNHGKNNHFIWLPKDEILDQGCTLDLFNSFNTPPYKFTGYNIKNLASLKIVAPFEINGEIFYLKLKCELKVHGSPARIFLFELQSDDCSAVLYLGGRYFPKGLHEENDIKNFRLSCISANPYKITLPTQNVQSNKNFSSSCSI